MVTRRSSCSEFEYEVSPHRRENALSIILELVDQGCMAHENHKTVNALCNLAELPGLSECFRDRIVNLDPISIVLQQSDDAQRR